LLTLALATALTAASCSQTPIHRNGPDETRLVSRTYAKPIDVVRTTILDAFATRATKLPAPFNAMVASPSTDRQYSEGWVNGYVDPGGFLDDYKSMPEAARRGDIVLDEPTGDLYWPSEYAGPDGVVRFHCRFILHVTDRGAAGTDVTVYEIVPTVWVGEHWAMTMHGIGFGRVHDIRFVDPTVTDRVKALDLIGQLLASNQTS
jgi:hypothetical protein